MSEAYCKGCNEVGMSHCSDPEHCGGPWDNLVVGRIEFGHGQDPLPHAHGITNISHCMVQPTDFNYANIVSRAACTDCGTQIVYLSGPKGSLAYCANIGCRNHSPVSWDDETPKFIKAVK